MTEQFKNNMLQTIVSTILFVGTGIVMLASQVPLIRKVSEYSVHIMLGLLLFSMISMVIGKSKIMFSGLACTAALCLFLKNASNDILNYPESNDGVELNVAHINLGNISPITADPIIKMLIDEEIDVVSFQELTPNWDDTLKVRLRSTFPHFKSERRIDFSGLAIYSQYPLIEKDIFMSNGMPNMNVVVSKENSNFRIISSYLKPALDNQSIKDAAHQLNRIADEVIISNRPLLALGEYNMVYWTDEIRNFRSITNLKNSRRDLVDGSLRVPYDHIFFSDALECTHFKEMKDVSQNYLGIMGSYQIKEEDSEYLSSVD